MKQTPIALLMILISFCGTFAASAVADTIVLQQGSNEYTGCSDTHIYAKHNWPSTLSGVDNNYENNTTLLLLTEHYKSSG
ncbi:hypothetical protein BVX97_04510 [bacterium E08(2017)]|nr:hypothetical protein BVX97_04510 [bacterium E08(2017)]